MKLLFCKNYISIKKFNPVVLPNFTVLTGVNGAGKTHLLQAIKNGSVKLNGISQREILYFDYNSFIIDLTIAEDEQKRNELIGRISREKAESYNYYQEKINKLREKINNYQPLQYALAQLILNDGRFKLAFESKKYIDSFLQKNNSLDANSLAQTDADTLGINDEFYHFLNAFFSKEGVISDLSSKEIDKEYNKAKKSLLTEFKKDDKNYFNFLENKISKKRNILSLKQEDFGNMSLFAFEISEEIKNYEIEYHEEKDVEHAFKKQLQKKFGRSPLKILNSILEKFDCNGYVINEPDFKPSFKKDNYKTLVPINLKHKKEKYITTLDQLSSGEQTLMAIAMRIYKIQKDNIFPRVLLLDEVDSALHPSMIQRLLDVIQDLFIEKNKMKVILVTHSPTTVALSPEKSIYLMSREGRNRIFKETKENAIRILSESYIVLSKKESRLYLDYNLSQTNRPVVFTEGLTDRIILENAWKKLYDNEMPFFIQDFFDAGALKGLFSRGNDIQNGVFESYKDKKLIALFDFDEEGYNSWNYLKKSKFSLQEENPTNCLTIKHEKYNAYALLLPISRKSKAAEQVLKNKANETFKNKSHLPIELLFCDVKSLSKYFIEEDISGGGKIVKFKGDKQKFAKNTENLLKDDFKNFKPLFKKINELIKDKEKKIEMKNSLNLSRKKAKVVV